MSCKIAPGLLCLLLVATPLFAQGANVKTVAFDSPSVGRKMKYNIVLPTNYEKSSDHYPVLYLLHGLTSNYTAWAAMNVPVYAAQYDLIVVMPDVGNTCYVNWAKTEGDQKNNWEDAIVKDLIGHVDTTYRTIARREGRGINGLSMGGFGGLMLGLKHPQLFFTVGSHSGAVAFARSFAERLRSGAEARPSREPSTIPDKRIGIENFSSQSERTPRGSIFTKPEECDAYDPFQLVLKLPKDMWPHLYFDCGTEDRLITSNVAFMKVLTDNKIPFTFAQSPGGHVPSYWAREVGNSMAAQYAAMKKQLASLKKDTPLKTR